jgi:hypothetical protein
MVVQEVKVSNTSNATVRARQRLWPGVFMVHRACGCVSTVVPGGPVTSTGLIGLGANLREGLA